MGVTSLANASDAAAAPITDLPVASKENVAQRMKIDAQIETTTHVEPRSKKKVSWQPPAKKRKTKDNNETDIDASQLTPPETCR